MTNATPKRDLDRLKQAMPIMELAKILGLEIRGHQARCFNGQAHQHGDRNPSLGLNTRDNRFKCFTCGEQGSVIDLFMAVKGVDLNQAIKELSIMAGLTPAIGQTSQRATSTPYKAFKPTPEPPSEPLGAYSDIYEELLSFCGGLDQESRDYLTGKTRGLTEETLNRFLLFSVKDYQATDKHLKEKFSKDELQRAGVIGEKGNLIFYKHKIITPFLQDGRIIFLQGRRLDPEQPKYLHLKRPVPLFNADRIAEVRKGERIYICEGVFDAMMLEQNNYKAVAILGVNNFKPEAIELFKGLDVVLCLDNDEAGERGIEKLAEIFNLKGQAVKNKRLPDGIKDITDYFIKL